MAETTAPARVEIGRCVVCKRAYRREVGGPAVWCECRKGVTCTDRPHVYEGEHDHPQTAIRWRPVQVTVTARMCDGRCQAAKSDKCACSCVGRNHGLAHGRTA